MPKYRKGSWEGKLEAGHILNMQKPAGFLSSRHRAHGEQVQSQGTDRRLLLPLGSLFMTPEGWARLPTGHALKPLNLLELQFPPLSLSHRLSGRAQLAQVASTVPGSVHLCWHWFPPLSMPKPHFLLN